jgi:hypothetical protein
MKTTEIFVEQVIIGFLVLLIAGLPFHWKLRSLLAGQDKPLEVFISLAAAAVGAAYLLGILFDRLADTLTEGVTRRQQREFEKGSGSQYWLAEYAVARMQIAIFGAGGDAADWQQYLRSRVRLSRALAVYLPALTFASVLALRPEHSRWWLLGVPIAYAPAYFVNAFPRQSTEHKLSGELKELALIKHQISKAVPKLKCAQKETKKFVSQLQTLVTDGNSLQKQLPIAKSMQLDLFNLAPIALLGSSLVLAWCAATPEAGPGSGCCTTNWQEFRQRITTNIALLVAVVGLILTPLSCWAFLRINKTYLRYLENFARFRERRRSSTAVGG